MSEQPRTSIRPGRCYVRDSVVSAPVEEVFAWHERPGAIQRLSPPWEPVRVENAGRGLRVGERTIFRTSVRGPVVLRWIAEHTYYDPPREFRDVQVSGPFASWEHRHRFDPVDGDGGQEPATRVTDEVSYEMPLRPAGDTAAWPIVQSRLRRMFDYRYQQLADDLAAHHRASERGAGTMRVAVAGSTGLIGSALVALLTSGGHRVTRLVRRTPSAPDEAYWNPARGEIDVDALRDVDAVVNVAGAPLVGRRWTQELKRRARDSRVQGTRLLAETLASMSNGPQVLVCGSAVGYYGYDRGDETLTEQSDSGGGFLAALVRDWEAAADPARKAGLRVVHVRTGLVQTPEGGILQVQLPLFQAALGGRLGSGKQWMSWISIDDIAGVFHHALTSPDLSGAVNGTAPQPVTNEGFTKTLGRVLGRPTPVAVPEFAPSLLLKEQGAKETALASQRVLPTRVEASGYLFRQPNLEHAFRHVLGRARRPARE